MDQNTNDLSWLQSEYECDACGISIVAVLRDQEHLDSDVWIRMVLDFTRCHKPCGFEL